MYNLSRLNNMDPIRILLVQRLVGSRLQVQQKFIESFRKRTRCLSISKDDTGLDILRSIFIRHTYTTYRCDGRAGPTAKCFTGSLYVGQSQTSFQNRASTLFLRKFHDGRASHPRKDGLRVQRRRHNCVVRIHHKKV